MALHPPREMETIRIETLLRPTVELLQAFMSAYFNQPELADETQAAASRDTETPFDVVFRGGLIVDGTGGEPYEGDVGVRAGRVSLLNAGEEALAIREIDIAGKVIAPGLIDIHTHARADLVDADRALMITTSLGAHGRYWK